MVSSVSSLFDFIVILPLLPSNACTKYDNYNKILSIKINFKVRRALRSIHKIIVVVRIKK